MMKPTQNCIFGDAMTVRLAPLKKSTSGYKIHCRSEKSGPEWPEESQIMQTCPGQAIQPISEQKNWKNQTFSFSEKRPFLGPFWDRLAENDQKSPRKAPKTPGMTLIYLKTLKIIDFRDKIIG